MASSYCLIFGPFFTVPTVLFLELCQLKNWGTKCSTLWFHILLMSMWSFYTVSVLCCFFLVHFGGFRVRQSLGLEPVLWVLKCFVSRASTHTQGICDARLTLPCPRSWRTLECPSAAQRMARFTSVLSVVRVWSLAKEARPTDAAVWQTEPVTPSCTLSMDG